VDDTAPPTDDVPWLDPDERRTWLALLQLTTLLPGSVEAQLGRDADLTFFEYSVLAVLSERPDGTARMSQLAMLANGSLSRLSHVARRLEAKGFIRREPLPDDGRITVAVLLDPGRRAVVAAAPGHVRHVRSVLFTTLSRAEVVELGRLAVKAVQAIDSPVSAAMRAAMRAVLEDR